MPKTFNIMTAMHFDLYLQLTYYVCVKCKHATPANIHTEAEVAWFSLNNCEDTTKVIILQ